MRSDVGQVSLSDGPPSKKSLARLETCFHGQQTVEHSLLSPSLAQNSASEKKKCALVCYCHAAGDPPEKCSGSRKGKRKCGSRCRLPPLECIRETPLGELTSSQEGERWGELARMTGRRLPLLTHDFVCVFVSRSLLHPTSISLSLVRLHCMFFCLIKWLFQVQCQNCGAKCCTGRENSSLLAATANEPGWGTIECSTLAGRTSLRSAIKLMT